jgi:ubiquinone/menaquinone biosynthesis C-methylase UbiE
MDEQERTLIEKIRQQFNFSSYPRIPIEKSPKNEYNILYLHNLFTPYYLRNRQVINPQEKAILDAGCGTGYKTLILAEANPGAKIVGVDISEESIKLAQERLSYHGFDQVEFYVLSVEELPKLQQTFDYINCDELLYLFDDISLGLKAMKSVLKPTGIIRSNLHSYFQRFNYFRAQDVFRLMGFMDENPEDMEIKMAIETMKALKDGVELKAKTWNPNYEGENNKETVLMNYLLQGDKGYTIPDLFNALRAADLEFVSMVLWRHWELIDLFKDPDDLPIFLAMGLSEIPTEQRLHLFELLQPIHRLLDFWCGHPGQADASVPIEQWELSDWQGAWVHLHPQLKAPHYQKDLRECIARQRPFEISRYIPAPTLVPITIESSQASCLLPLWEEPQSVMSLVERWLKIKPLHPVTLEPMSEQAAFAEIQELLTTLEAFLYVLLQR